MKLILLFPLLVLCSCNTIREAPPEVNHVKNISVPTQFKENSKWSEELHLIISKSKEFSDVLKYAEWIESNHFVSQVGCGDFKNHPSFEKSGGKCFDLSIDFRSQNKSWVFYLFFTYKEEQIHMTHFQGHSYSKT